MKDLSDVKVGDTLYEPGIHQDHRIKRKPQTFYVLKVARQYLYASADKDETDIKKYSTEKIDRKTGRTVGMNGWFEQQFYRSKEEYDEVIYRRELVEKIKLEFGREHRVVVPDITTEELQGIAKTLGVEF